MRDPTHPSVLLRLDGLAVEFGLERVKTTGVTYHAVCGVSRPYLDHAPRAVGFGLAAAELVDDLASEHRADLAPGVGVASGPVSVGLTGRAGLVYDAWGPVVTAAAGLARRAPRGAVLVSDDVRRQLPSDYVLAVDGDGGAGTVVAARETEATS